MIRLVLHELRSRPWRAVLTGLGAVVGVGLVAATLVLADSAIGRQDETVSDVMLIAGAVALLVGAFIISSTFSVTVAQRSRELALLRCLGATAGQLRRMVRLESMILGIGASLTGLGSGVAVAAVLRWWMRSGNPGGAADAGLVVAPGTLAVSILAGTLVTVVSGLAAARRAGQVPPVAALLDRPAAGPGRRRRGTRVGAVLGIAGVTAVPIAVLTEFGPALILAGLLILVAVRLSGPSIGALLARAIGRPIRRAWPVTGDLAWRNAARSPERTAAAASALMIGLMLVSLISVLAASARAGAVAEFDRTFHADAYLRAAGGSYAPMGSGVVERLLALPQVDEVVSVRRGEASLDGRPGFVYSADPAGLSQMLSINVVEGGLADMATGAVAVSRGQADARHWAIGTVITVSIGGQTLHLTVKAVYDSGRIGSPLLAPADYTQMGGEPGPREVYVRSSRGVAPATTVAAVEQVVAGYPAVEVLDRAHARTEAQRQIADASRFYLALTGLSILVGLFGIATTLALAMVERTPELGLLRAVGMTRRDIRAMIRADAVIIAVMGVVPGLGLGTLFGWGAAKVLENSSSPTVFEVPAATLAVVAIAAVLAGIAASAVPARLASRVDLLRAIGGR